MSFDFTSVETIATGIIGVFTSVSTYLFARRKNYLENVGRGLSLYQNMLNDLEKRINANHDEMQGLKGQLVQCEEKHSRCERQNQETQQELRDTKNQLQELKKEVNELKNSRK